MSSEDKVRPCEVCGGRGMVEDGGSAIGRAFILGAIQGGRGSDERLGIAQSAIRKAIAHLERNAPMENSRDWYMIRELRESLKKTRAQSTEGHARDGGAGDE